MQNSGCLVGREQGGITKMKKTLSKNRKNSFYKALGCTILILAIVLYTQIFAVSASEWDNVKSYNPSQKAVTIKNSILGIIPTNEIAKITLVDNTNYCITHCSALIKLELLTDYATPFQSLDFYNSKLKTIRKTITNDIYLRTKTTQVEVNDYTKVCSLSKTLGNGTRLEDCSYVKSGSHTEERYEYSKYANGNLPAGTYYFKIEGTKQPRENIEWIPTFMGLELNEYAPWYSGLNNELFAYYSFEENAGTLVNDLINHTAQGTLLGTPLPTWTDGKVGYGIQINGTTNYLSILNTSEINDAFGGNMTGNRTINLWINMTQQTNIIGKGDGTNNENYWSLSLDEGGGDYYYSLRAYKDATHYLNVRTKDRPPSENHTNFGNWTMITLTKRDTGVGAGNYTLYVNNLTLPWDANNDNDPQDNILNQNITLTIGNKTSVVMDYGRNFTFDELGIWNRVLSTQEISDLYNNRTGISYDSGTVGVVVTLDTPIDNYEAIDSSITFNASFTATYGNLSNATLYVWNPDGSLFGINFTNNIYGISNYSNLSLSGLALRNNYKWNYYVCANNSIPAFICKFGTNRTFSKIAFVINSQTYNASTYETSLENFNANITYDTSSFSLGNTYLIYNGTGYLSSKSVSGNNVILSKSLTIPVVISSGTNHSFYWNVGLTNSSGTFYYNSSSINQTIYKGTSLSVSETCSAGYLPAFNFTFFYEQNLTDINASVINYYLTYGLPGNANAYSINNTILNTNKFSICINSSQPYYDVGYGEIAYSSEISVNRRYYLFGGTRITNTTIEIPLYNLESAISKPFSITAQTPTLIPYVNYYISLLRWYPQLNSYRVVDMGKTDDKGQTILNVKTEDVDYRLGIYNSNGKLIQLLNPIRMICLTTPCTYSVFVELTPMDLTGYTNIQNNLSFDPITKQVTFIWNDPSQASQTMNLSVWQIGSIENTIVCSASASGYTGILICDLSAYTGTFKAEVKRSANPNTIFNQLIIAIKNTFVDVGGGSLGLFIGAIILIFFALIGTISPILVVILGIISLIPLYLLGNIGWEVMAGIGVIGGVILHFLKRTT